MIDKGSKQSTRTCTTQSSWFGVINGMYGDLGGGEGGRRLLRRYTVRNVLF